MSVGFVMLAHTALDRAAQVARAIAAEDCPVIIHIDRRVNEDDFQALVEAVDDEPRIGFSRRFRCEWGTWSLIEAARTGAEMLLAEDASIRHVMLISGACLPIKPVAELKTFLAENTDTDFIESVTVDDVPWTEGGLSEERFSLTFPFAWKRHRRLFDLWVDLQRRAGRHRSLPVGVQPHLGSQWWCLSRPTLERILTDERRDELDRFFRRVWIPDESYFQTLVRLYGAKVESRSLTLSKFDFQGKPHVFYDDHLGLLADSPAYFARKIWPRAGRLYETFLSGEVVRRPMSSAMPGTFANRVFGEAVSQRTMGRAGLAMAGRFPREGFENGVTAAPYAVFHGFGDVFSGFPDWLSEETGSRVHGRLFSPDRCEFADGARVWAGALSDSAALRDYDPEAFLRSLIWNTRGEHQSFLLAARDTLAIGDMLARDRNASIFVVSGAWAVPLARSDKPVSELRETAAHEQAKEAAFIERLKERRSLANVHVWSLADVLERPAEPLQAILDDMTGAETRSLSVRPDFVAMDAVPRLLQELKNAGMSPHTAGEIEALSLPHDAVPTSNVIRLR